MSHAERGFTLVEMMVALTIMSIGLSAAGAFFVSSRNAVSDEMARQETLQGLRATLDTLERDLRLGGACLPTTGIDFPALSGSNAGTLDGLTTRTALVRADMTCIQGQLCTCVQNGQCVGQPTCPTAGISAGATTIPLQSVSGFAVGQRGYIRGTNSAEYFNITAVDTSTGQLTIAKPLQAAYANASGVYAIDERVYNVNATTYAPVTVLTIAVNGGQAVPFAYGVQSVDVHYELASNCPPCDVVDLPTAAQWPLVNQLYVTVTMKSQKALSTGQYFTASGTIGAKPRNLLPGTQVLGPAPS